MDISSEDRLVLLNLKIPETFSEKNNHT